MSNRTTKTENAHLKEKLQLRNAGINEANITELKVLDCYHANGTIWGHLKQRYPDLKLLGIELKKDLPTMFECITGDNLQVVKDLNISEYNVIDLDSFSDCTDLLLYLYPLAKNGTLFFYTQNFNRISGPPANIKGNEKAINKKVKSITNNFIDEKWSGFLNNLGVKKYKELNFKEGWYNKKYGYFIKEGD